MKNDIVLQVKDLNFSYDGNNLLKDINFELPRGKILGVVGKSGCGKSTLLKVIAGFIKPNSGEIIVSNKNHCSPTRNVMYLNQDYNQLFPWLDVKKNITFPLGRTKDKYNQTVLDYLRYLELENKAHHYPFQLSGGQKQRVTLARALIINPDVLLLDEPFNCLDISTRLKLQKTSKSIIKKTNTATIFVTHDIKEALYMSDYLMVFTKNEVLYYNDTKKINKSFLSGLI